MCVLGVRGSFLISRHTVRIDPVRRLGPSPPSAPANGSRHLPKKRRPGTDSWAGSRTRAPDDHPALTSVHGEPRELTRLFGPAHAPHRRRRRRCRRSFATERSATAARPWRPHRGQWAGARGSCLRRNYLTVQCTHATVGLRSGAPDQKRVSAVTVPSIGVCCPRFERKDWPHLTELHWPLTWLRCMELVSLPVPHTSTVSARSLDTCTAKAFAVWGAPHRRPRSLR